MLSLLVTVGLLMVAQPSPEADVFISTECNLPGGADCHLIIYQLEIAGVPLTTGDFTQEECQALRNTLLPGLVLAGIKDEPQCVAYAVQRDPV